MIDWDVKEKGAEFEKNLRGILDDMYYESLNREGADVESLKELAISRIRLLHGKYQKDLMVAISDCLRL